jgi:hypothetical protein
LAVGLNFLTLLDATHKLNVVFVSDFPGTYIISVQAIETGKTANPCIFFLACFTTKMYVYCAYPAMSKSSSQLPNMLDHFLIDYFKGN